VRALARAGRGARTVLVRSALLTLGALLARAALPTAARRVTGLTGTNFRGRPVSLAAGPALGVAASVTAAYGRPERLGAASLIAGLGATAVGRYDDIVSARPAEETVKGLAGHLRALRAGRITAGTVKLAGLSASALAAAALLPSPHRGGRRLLDVALASGVIAGTANLVNLLDRRPGRALKMGLLLGVPMTFGRTGAVVAGPVGAAAALLPADLEEQVMLGDSGANAIGALLGVGLAARAGTAGRAGLLAALAGMTLASERVSFSAVIDATPPLRRVDQLGRRP
jgi:UDP-N-acetylmuramyl pentapeptide phosphotransferase/UDP-N-acetylglucosamine-1-phosphate transferase